MPGETLGGMRSNETCAFHKKKSGLRGSQYELCTIATQFQNLIPIGRGQGCVMQSLSQLSQFYIHDIESDFDLSSYRSFGPNEIKCSLRQGHCQAGGFEAATT